MESKILEGQSMGKGDRQAYENELHVICGFDEKNANSACEKESVDATCASFHMYFNENVKRE